MVVDRAEMAARDHHHRAVLEVAIVEHDADRGEIVIGVRIKRPILVPFDRRAITSRLHVELAGVEAHRAPQILQHLDDLRMPRRPRIFGVVQMRRLDAPHPRLGGRMRIFKVVDFVIGGDIARVTHELVGDPAQRFGLLRRQDVGQHDEPVAAIGGEVGLRQHGSSIGSGSEAIAEPRGPACQPAAVWLRQPGEASSGSSTRRCGATLPMSRNSPPPWRRANKPCERARLSIMKRSWRRLSGSSNRSHDGQALPFRG